MNATLPKTLRGWICLLGVVCGVNAALGFAYGGFDVPWVVWLAAGACPGLIGLGLSPLMRDPRFDADLHAERVRRNEALLEELRED